LRDFINNVYVPDVLAIAEVHPTMPRSDQLSRAALLRAFDLDNEADVSKRNRMFTMGRHGRTVEPLDPSRITEDVRYSWYRSASHAARVGRYRSGSGEGIGLHLAPRRRAMTMSRMIGPLARAVIMPTTGKNGQHVKAIDSALTTLRLTPENLFSVMGRHLARALKRRSPTRWRSGAANQLEQPVAVPHVIPDEREATASGMHSRGRWDTGSRSRTSASSATRCRADHVERISA
jgi:hydrogenase large subunit